MAIKFTYAFNPGTQDFDTAPEFVSHWLTLDILGLLNRGFLFPPLPFFLNIAMTTQNFISLTATAPEENT